MLDKLRNVFDRGNGDLNLDFSKDLLPDGQKLGFQPVRDTTSSEWELTSFQKCLRYGIAASPSASAYDPVQGLLAIGDHSGTIMVFGRRGVEVTLRVTIKAAQVKTAHVRVPRCIKHLVFQIGAGRIVSVDAHNVIYIWDLCHKSICADNEYTERGPMAEPEMKYQSSSNSLVAANYSFDTAECKGSVAKARVISAISLPCSSKWMFIGHANGGISSLNVERNEISPYKIPVPTLDGDEYASWLVVSISAHPHDPYQLLIGYENGLIVLWDWKSRCALHRYQTLATNLSSGNESYSRPSPYLTTLHWNESGRQFVAGYERGMFAFWDVKNERSPKSVHSISKGPGLGSSHSVENEQDDNIEPIFKQYWSYFDDDHTSSLLITAGGQNRDGLNGIYIHEYQDEKDYHAPRKQHLLSINHEIIDFIILPSSTPWYNGCRNPKALIVFTNEPMIHIYEVQHSLSKINSSTMVGNYFKPLQITCIPWSLQLYCMPDIVDADFIPNCSEFMVDDIASCLNLFEISDPAVSSEKLNVAAGVEVLNFLLEGGGKPRVNPFVVNPELKPVLFLATSKRLYLFDTTVPGLSLVANVDFLASLYDKASYRSLLPADSSIAKASFCNSSRSIYIITDSGQIVIYQFSFHQQEVLKEIDISNDQLLVNATNTKSITSEPGLQPQYLISWNLADDLTIIQFQMSAFSKHGIIGLVNSSGMAILVHVESNVFVTVNQVFQDENLPATDMAINYIQFVESLQRQLVILIGTTDGTILTSTVCHTETSMTLGNARWFKAPGNDSNEVGSTETILLACIDQNGHPLDVPVDVWTNELCGASLPNSPTVIESPTGTDRGITEQVAISSPDDSHAGKDKEPESCGTSVLSADDKEDISRRRKSMLGIAHKISKVSRRAKKAKHKMPKVAEMDIETKNASGAFYVHATKRRITVYHDEEKQSPFSVLIENNREIYSADVIYRENVGTCLCCLFFGGTPSMALFSLPDLRKMADCEHTLKFGPGSKVTREGILLNHFAKKGFQMYDLFAAGDDADLLRNQRISIFDAAIEIPTRPVLPSIRGWIGGFLGGSNEAPSMVLLDELLDGGTRKLESNKDSSGEKEGSNANKSSLHVTAMAHVMTKNTEALNERGEKLADLNNKFSDVANDAKNFLEMAKEMNRKAAKKKWYEL